MNFLELNLIAPVYRAVQKAGYETPTPIQAQAIPLLLQSKDFIGIAQTGTGKTAAFVMPLLQKLELQESQPEKNKPKALILAPTRELAAQIQESCKTYGVYTKIKSAAIFGGVNQKQQVKALERGVHILVATPGRLLDLIEQKHVNLGNTRTLILDEADRMLDMGFVREIRKLLPLLPHQRQTVMFSATMSRAVEQLAQDFLKNPETIKIAARDTRNIHQELYYVDKTEKNNLLLHLLKKQLDHVLIFVRTKAGANKTAKLLAKQGFPAEAMHGDKTQNQRIRTLKKFSEGKIILVATDVAARGIDVEGISHVINYDLPNDPENYTHRIGRTARAGAKGTAYSFCDEHENEYLRAIQKETGNKLTHVNHPFHSEAALKSRLPPPKHGQGGQFSKGFGSGPRKRFKKTGKPAAFGRKNFKGSGYKKRTTRRKA